jgi:cytochrome b
MVRCARQNLGHSPAGRAMVIALLIFLSPTAVTRLIAYGERSKVERENLVVAMIKGRKRAEN